MNVFDIKATISNTCESIAFLTELLEQQKKLLVLQKELECVLQDAAKFDPLDQEWTGLQRQADLISDQIQELTTPFKVDGDALKSRDLIPVLVSNLDSEINTLVSIHCGTPQPGTHCGVSDGTVFIC